MADAFRGIEESPAERRAGQQAAQRQLAQSAVRLAEQLAEAGRRLGTEPLNLDQPGHEADEAGQAAHRAQQAMGEAAGNLGRGNIDEAAEAARRAAEALRQASAQAATGAGHESPGTPIPSDLADQVAEAARRLAEAHRRLSELDSEREGNPSDSPAEGQPGAQGPLAEASQQLQQAAQALARAAQRLQPPPFGTDQAPEAGEQPSQEGDPGNAGTGGQVPFDPQALEAELERFAAREWGRLPSQLRTEILQGSPRRSDSEYSRLIKLYFEEIARPEE